MKKYILNLIWMLSDRVLMLAFQLYVFSSIKRNFGTEVLGGWATINNLSQILISLFMLGIDIVVIKRIVEDKSAAGKEMGSAITIQVAGAIFYSVILLFIIKLFYNNIQFVWLYYSVFVIANLLSIFAKSIFWHYSALLEARLRAITIITSIILSFATVVLINQYKPQVIFLSFAVYYFLQLIISMFIYYFVFSEKARWSISRECINVYLRSGSKLIISTLSVAIFVQADTLMLEKLSGLHEVGIFNAALRISTIWFFVAGIVSTAFFPKIVDAKKNSSESLFLMKWMTGSLLIATLIISVLVTIFGKYIVWFLYGKDMDQAIIVLSIHIWSSIFVFMGAFSSKWLFANNEINIEVTKTVIAALFNVIANYFFIPYYGAIGASIVSMFAYFIANILVLALLKKTRIIILEQLKSFVYVIHPLKYYRDCRKAICLFR